MDGAKRLQAIKQMNKITLDNFCPQCNGEGSVLNPDSGDGELCLRCMGAKEVHRTYDLPLILIYQEGGQIQHIIRIGDASVLVFDDTEDDDAFKKFQHIIEQTGGDTNEMEWEDVAW